MYRNLGERFGGNGYGITHKKKYSRVIIKDKCQDDNFQVVPGITTRLWESKTIWRRRVCTGT